MKHSQISRITGVQTCCRPPASPFSTLPHTSRLKPQSVLYLSPSNPSASYHHPSTSRLVRNGKPSSTSLFACSACVFCYQNAGTSWQRRGKGTQGRKSAKKPYPVEILSRGRCINKKARRVLHTVLKAGHLLPGLAGAFRILGQA